MTTMDNAYFNEKETIELRQTAVDEIAGLLDEAIRLLTPAIGHPDDMPFGDKLRRLAAIFHTIVGSAGVSNMAEVASLATKAHTLAQAGSTDDLDTARALLELINDTASAISRYNTTPGSDDGAIQKRLARLELENQIATFKIDILGEIINLLPRSQNQWATIGFILDRIFSIIEMDGVSVLVADEEKTSLTFRAVRGGKEEEITGLAIDASAGIAGKVFSSGRPLVVADVSKCDVFLTQFDELTGYRTRSVVAVPLKFYGETLGVLEGVNIGTDEIRSADRMLELFTTIANIISLLIHNTLEIESVYKSLDLSRRFLDISRAVSSSLELADVLAAVMEAARDILKTEASSLLLLDRAKQNLVFHVARGEKKDLLHQRTFPVSQGIAGHVVRTGQALIIHDAATDSRFDPSFDHLTGFVTRDVLCVPVTLNSEIIGVLEVINRIGNPPFSDKDADMLRHISHESAVALRNAMLHEEQKRLLAGATDALSTLLPYRNEYLGGHAQQVAHLAVQTAKFMRPDAWAIHDIVRKAALLHDVGMIAVPDDILRKPAPLSPDETRLVHRHPAISHEIVSRFCEPNDPVLKAIMHHHERYDGKGYLNGLSGDSIPFAARIIAVADAFDAITSQRPYRPAKTPEEALSIIRQCAGSQFDPDVVGDFICAYENGIFDIASPAADTMD